MKNDGTYPDSVKYYAQGRNVLYYICTNSIIQHQFEIDCFSDSSKMITSQVNKLIINKSNGLNVTKELVDTSFNKITLMSNTKSSKELYFKNVYDGIDQKFYFENGKIRFDFIVNPGSDPAQISLFSNDSLINKKNELLSNNWGLQDLYTYQEIDNKEIYSKFVQDGKNIKFEIGHYDPTQKLIIDPLLYSTFIGGLDIDSGEDIVIDNEGSIIVVGETASPNFPTTLGSYQREITLGDGITSDIFVTKVDFNYNHIFTTYIGSSGDDFGRGVDVDDNGNIYITGFTRNAENFPVSQTAYDTSYGGFSDAFVLRLSPDGDEVLNSTLLGGNRDDFGLAIKVLPDNSVAVTGYTSAAPDVDPFPTTTGVFNNIYLGKIDGFVTRLNEDLTDILWSGFLGGLDDDFPQDIAIGEDGSVYVAGLTRSENFITTDGVLFRDYNDNNNSPQHSDAFITKISPDGQQIILSSVFGGSNGDIAYGLTVDRDENIYIAGETRSSNLPTPDNAPFRDINRGNDQVFTADAFFAKFSPQADQLLAGSYLGGVSTERAFDIDIDALRNIYLVGTTSSENFPVTDFAYDTRLNDSVKYSDIFISKFNSKGDSLSYSTFFGADRSDLAKALKVRNQNRVVFTGNTSSTFLETTNDAIQVSYQNNGKEDAHFAEFFLDDFGDADVTICAGESVILDSEITSSTTTLFYSWSPEESLDDPNVEFPVATPDRSTIYTCVVSDTLGERFVAQVLVAVIASLSTEIEGEINVDNGVEYFYSTKVNFGSNYNWTAANGSIISGQGTNNVRVIWDDADFGSLRLIETSRNGCRDTAFIFTNFEPSLPWDVYPFGDHVFCEGDTILLDAGSEFEEVVWQDGWSGRYDTVYVSGRYSFVGRRANGTIYNSPEAEIVFLEKPRKPTIIFSEQSKQLVCISAAENYYWFLDNEFIPGSNSRFLNPIGPGCYQVSIENLDSCINKSDDFCIENKSVDLILEKSKIYPNPSHNLINFELYSSSPNNELTIFNSIGKPVFRKNFNYKYEDELDLSLYGRGIYFVLIDNIFYQKIVIY